MLKKRMWLRSMALLCAGALMCSSMGVYAQEYRGEPVQEQVEENPHMEDVPDTNELEKPEEGVELPEEQSELNAAQEKESGQNPVQEEETEPNTVPGEGFDQDSNQEEKKESDEGFDQDSNQEEKKELNEEPGQDSDQEKKNESDEESKEMPDQDIVAVEIPDTEDIGEEEKGLNPAAGEQSDLTVQEEGEEEVTEQESEEEDDPQSGISMSNVEESGEEEVVFSARSYTGSNYVHNSRYDNGYNIVNGVDVSYHNGTIDWNAVADSGIEYAMIRVGYRGYAAAGKLREDPKFRENIEGALAAGLKVGVYIFSQAITKEEAIEEADFVLDRIAGYNITLPVTIDFEYADGNTGRLYNAHLSRTRATSICRNFCRTIKADGYTAMVYANKSMLENQLHADELGEENKIWLANYTTKTSYSGDYYAWQYTSKGRVSGISGNADCNFFYEKGGNGSNGGNSTGDREGARTYVQRLYWELLGREADEAGLNTRVNAIANGSSSASDIVLAVIESAEFKNRNISDRVFVDSLYWALLDRGTSDDEMTKKLEQLKAGVSRRYILSQITNSPEFLNVCNNLKISKGSVQTVESRDRNPEVTAYVSRCYENILERSADPEGLNTWTEKILSGNGGAEIVKDLVLSREFSNRKKTDAEFIDILYRSMLERESDQEGKGNWLKSLSEGVSYVYIINGFAGSREFNNLCAKYGIRAGSAVITEARDSNIGVTGFVNRNYKLILGREGEVSGLNYWCDAINRKISTPGQVAYGFVFSQEVRNKNLNHEDFVEMLYKTFLERDSEPAGKQDWVKRLNTGTSRENVFWGFANSAEFSAIVSRYGL